MAARTSTYNGYQLCSSRDPLKEAGLWCDHLEKNESFLGRNSNATHYWVLGLGAGFHIEELARRKSQSVISVFEPRVQCRADFAEIGTSLSGQVIIEDIESTQDLFNSRSFQIFGSSTMSVYRFAPSLHQLEGWARSIEEALLGRSAEGFLKISQMLGMSIAQNSDRLEKVVSANIKEINALLDGAPMNSEKQLVSLLRELVR